MVEEDGSVLINSRLLTYDLKVGLDVRNKTKGLGYDDITTLNVVCAKQFMLNAEDVVELEASYEAAKAYLAWCNDSEALDFNQWQLKRFEIEILYRNLREFLERA